MIGIIYIGSINRCPYLKNYTNCLDELAIDYEIISWDRSENTQAEVVESNAQAHHVFKHPSKEQRSPIYKIADFYRFRKYAKKIIHNKNYEKLVVLTTMSGVVILKELCNQYKNKYIFDYRDASFEFFKPFKSILKKIVINSSFTSISSKGFLEVLPEYDNYVMAHNCSSFETLTSNNQIGNSKVVVGYIGGLRESDYMKSLMDIFGNDNRFEFIAHGGGENLQELKDYSAGMNNVIFTGEYSETQKKDLIKGLHLICYNYPESFINNLALANKFYDGLLYRKPFLGNINTYSGKLIKSNDVGISLDLKDKEYKNKLYDYYINHNPQAFEKRCDLLLSEIKDENKVYQKNIKDFFMNEI
ncbi:glycosyltransferase family 4 protein [Sporosarcina sp. ANT_H38]|uniref:glycosyltransferase family 4 protein n=1 Tax=Sporosarcina sp. ANT_H38 TaxID=2597358 RepID=UPI0011F3E4AD|nr:glycosyltransferase family 4 protein [Sporosarcina sp. ANT_H38]KAA0955537.1 glycosyltransferase family 4 protein [Sporosarcina sp. ANT_H38]